ncbi:MAG TPA: aspartate kinase [Polyangiaceae bacterium]
MATIVQKFGGSSLADLEKLGKVADLVMATRRAGHDLVVVVSAMGKTTDGLLELARKAACPGAEASAEPARRELDMLVSTGERVSMALLSIAIRARGGDAVSLTGSQSGIITNDRHFDARILEVRPFRIEDELARGRIVIVAGYQGMSYRREITTLGRGGSDTTAVALAAALDAERCEIYSDVDGVYTADPKRVPGAMHLSGIDYETMQEMAECGAKVLNARAVEWARRHRITIAARRTDDFACGERGRETLVSAELESSLRPRAIVGERGLALLRAPARSARELLSAAAAAELTLRDLTLEGGRLCASLALVSCPDFGRARARLAAAAPDGLELLEGLAQVSVVGVGVGSDPGIACEAFVSLPEAPLAFSTTPLRASAVLPDEALLAAERAWHAAFAASPELQGRTAA